MQNSNPLLAAFAMIVSVSTAIASTPLTTSTSTQPLCQGQSGSQVMPLVELYTSEGCSSCPPADRWLSRVYANHQANFLAFHVDYWDRLGWPDRFAQPAYSARQRQRVNAAGERTVYTPQVMVGTQIQVDWRSDADFTRVLAGERRPATMSLALSMDSTAAGAQIRLEATRLQPSNGESSQVWLAQYSDAEVTRVEHGENGGATLHHDRVVRQLWGPWTLGSEPIVQLVGLQHVGLQHVDLQHVDLQHALASGGVTAFAQDQTGRVQQSLSLAGESCASAHE